MSVTDSAVYLYKKHGYDALAAQSYFSAIFVYLDQQDYEKAGELLDIYRQESGLFDEYGNIAKGRESYYGGKAMYYKGIGQLDSAEYYYKKLPDSKKMEKYVGLADMFEQKGNVDSTILYSNLYRRSINDFVTNLHAQSMRQVQGMYDYTRNQKIATTKIIEANHTKMLLFIVTAIFVLVALTISLIFIRNKNKRQNQLFKLNQQYISTFMQLKRYEDELSNMVKNDEQKEKEIEILHQRISMFHEKFQTLENSDKIQSIMSCPIIDRINNNLKPHCPVEPILTKDWDELYVIISEALPVFGNTVINNVNLTQPERQIAVLTKLGFRTNDIALVLEAYPQRITTIRATVNSKLFGDKSARTLAKNLKSIN